MVYQASELSKYVGFRRKHHPIPSMAEVKKAYMDAKNGDIDGAIRLLDWRRHCFYVKDNYDQKVMAAIFQYCSMIIR